ncbi:hypothetical protein ACVV2G_32320 [Streptomyces ziwulingensis]
MAGEGDLWRRLSRTLEQAVTTLPDGAVLVLAVDAADNSAVAARERDERSFLENLVAPALRAIPRRTMTIPVMTDAEAAGWLTATAAGEM